MADRELITDKSQFAFSRQFVSRLVYDIGDTAILGLNKRENSSITLARSFKCAVKLEKD